MPACPQCRAENAVGSPACRACGARLAAPAPAPGPQAARPRITLRVVRADGGSEVAFLLKKDEAVAGAAGDIVLMDDPFVARRQARFFFQGSVPAVEDIGGGNGVYVRLKQEQPLSAGQELRCGRQRLLVEPLTPPTGPRVWGSPDAGARFRLVQLLEGGRKGDAFPLKEGENLLGRDSGDITFPGDGFVSGRHAAVVVQGDRLFFRDLGSSNGSFVRLQGPVAIERGDQLLIGKHLVKVDVQA